NPRPPDVRIDWSGLARRARRLTVPGTTIGGLTAAPEGHSVALTVSTPGTGGGRGANADAGGGMFIVNVESGQVTRVPPAAAVESAGRGGGRGAPGGGGPGVGGASLVFAHDGRTLFFRAGTNLFAAPVNLNAGATPG